MPRVSPSTTKRARVLRTNTTPEERAIWHLIRHHRPRFTRQLPVGLYILDFACRASKLAIELDGSQHLDAVEHDAKRTVFLESLGWTVIRFWNAEVRADAHGVAAAILARAVPPRGPTHPQPLPSREGSDSASDQGDIPLEM